MGCRSSKSTVNAVNLDAQVSKLASNNLPPEVMAGLDKILRTNATTGPPSVRKSPNRPLEGLATEETQRASSQVPSLAATKVEVSAIDSTTKEDMFPVKVSGFKDDFALDTGRGVPDHGLETYRKIVTEAPMSQEPLPGVLYDEPLTNPYFELMKTQADGRMPLEVIDTERKGSPSPKHGPRLAFGGDFTGLTTEKISVA